MVVLRYWCTENVLLKEVAQIMSSINKKKINVNVNVCVSVSNSNRHGDEVSYFEKKKVILQILVTAVVNFSGIRGNIAPEKSLYSVCDISYNYLSSSWYTLQTFQQTRIQESNGQRKEVEFV